jgi:hypothetical protein
MKKIFSFLSKNLIACLLFLLTFFFYTPLAYAGEMTNARDTMTRQKISTASAHTIDIRLADGTNFDATGGKDVLAVQFPATFSSSGTWTTGDITFWQDQTRSSASTLTQVTIAQVVSGAGISTNSLTCNNDNQVGIAIDTTNLIFRVQPCTTTYTASDAGGTNIGAMRIIILQDGANGELTNPSSAADSISIAIFHDDEGVSKAHTGELRVSILSDDQASFTATTSPTFTFALNTSTTLAACPSTSQSSAGSITFSSAFIQTDINVSNVFVCTYIFSNSGQTIKATLYGSSTNGALISGGYSIPDGAYSSNASVILSPGIEGYGVCMVSNGGNSNATAISPFNSTCTYSTSDRTVGSLSSSLGAIWNTTANTAYANILMKVAISSSTEAGTYTDTLYFVGVGTF